MFIALVIPFHEFMFNSSVDSVRENGNKTASVNNAADNKANHVQKQYIYHFHLNVQAKSTCNYKKKI